MKQRLWGRGSRSGDEKQQDNDSVAAEHTWGYFLRHVTWSWKQWIRFPNIMLTQNHAASREPLCIRGAVAVLSSAS